MKQRYLITGGAGFIGSHLAEFLLKGGNAVTVIDNFSSGIKDNLAECFKSSDFHCISGDVCDEGVLRNAAADQDVIVHLAASVGVRKVLADPRGCIENNLHSTENVLKAALHNQCKVFLASSSEVYGKLLKEELSETDGSFFGSVEYSRWSYAAAKLVDEHLALAFSRQHGLRVVIGRFFNVAGARQSAAYGMVIPRFIAQALRGEALTIYGDGDQVRTFCNVHDVVRGIALLCSSEDCIGNIYNIGSTEKITIKELALKVIAVMKSSSQLAFISGNDLPGGFDDTQFRCPDISKIQAAVGWKPKSSIDDILLSAACKTPETALFENAEL